jgi:hypothetical protein
MVVAADYLTIRYERDVQRGTRRGKLTKTSIDAAPKMKLPIAGTMKMTP